MTKNEAVLAEAGTQTTSMFDVANELLFRARAAAGIFTQYNQQEVDRIVDAAAKAEQSLKTGAENEVALQHLEDFLGAVVSAIRSKLVK